MRWSAFDPSYDDSPFAGPAEKKTWIAEGTPLTILAVHYEAHGTRGNAFGNRWVVKVLPDKGQPYKLTLSDDARRSAAFTLVSKALEEGESIDPVVLGEVETKGGKPYMIFSEAPVADEPF